MSAISSVGSSPVPAAPVVPTAPKVKAAPVSAPQTSSQVVSLAAEQVAAQAAATAKVNATSYRNSFGDTVSIAGIVLKDRDGDGGVGLPAAKVEAK